MNALTLWVAWREPGLGRRVTLSSSKPLKGLPTEEDRMACRPQDIPEQQDRALNKLMFGAPLRDREHCSGTKIYDGFIPFVIVGGRHA